MGAWIEATQASSAPLRVVNTFPVLPKPTPMRMRLLGLSANLVRTMPQQNSLQHQEGDLGAWFFYCSLPAVAALTNDSENVCYGMRGLISPGR
jgi:hypothetical protein